MIKLTKTYKNAIQKYGNIGVLNMYRDSKIDLNAKEWKNLHGRINKDNDMVKNVKRSTILCFITGFAIIIAICSKFNIERYQEQIYECRREKGHICTKYEMEKMFGKD